MGHRCTFAAALVALFFAATAFAAAPRNDNLRNAQRIRLGSVTIGTTVGATRERFEPYPAYDGGKGTVWYKLRATRTEDVSLSTCAATSDQHLGVFQGTTVKTLKRVAAGDHDLCPARRTGPNSYGGTGATFKATAGQTYLIEVGAWQSKDQARFQLTVAELAQLANDAFAAPRTIRVGGRVVQNNVLASAEPNEPRHARAKAAHSLWFKFKAPATGRFQLSTEASSFDTRLAVYRGNALSSLKGVGSNDDASNRTVSSRLTFKATKGTVYRIALDGVKTRVSTGIGDAVLSLKRPG